MKKTITWNVVIILTLFILIELISSRAFFHRNSVYHSLSTIWIVDGIAKKIDRAVAQNAGSLTKDYDFDRVFLSPESQIEMEFRDYLVKKYEKDFQDFISQARANEAEILIFWTPTRKSLNKNLVYGDYFERLAKKTGTHFVSMKELLSENEDHVFMIPYDEHLTRFSNHMIADRLHSYITQNITYKKKGFNCRDIAGFYRPNSSILLPVLPEIPYMVSIDEFGFRRTQVNSYDIDNHNILILGPSFTFGPYLSFYDTYPSILSRRNDDWNVMNAGEAGIGIESSTSILKNSGSCLNPAIIILQVVEHDIKNSAVMEYNQYNFMAETLTVPEIEKNFYKSIL